MQRKGRPEKNNRQINNIMRENYNGDTCRKVKTVICERHLKSAFQINDLEIGRCFECQFGDNCRYIHSDGLYKIWKNLHAIHFLKDKISKITQKFLTNNINPETYIEMFRKCLSALKGAYNNISQIIENVVNYINNLMNEGKLIIFFESQDMRDNKNYLITRFYQISVRYFKSGDEKLYRNNLNDEEKVEMEENLLICKEVLKMVNTCRHGISCRYGLSCREQFHCDAITSRFPNIKEEILNVLDNQEIVMPAQIPVYNLEQFPIIENSSVVELKEDGSCWSLSDTSSIRNSDKFSYTHSQKSNSSKNKKVSPLNIVWSDNTDEFSREKMSRIPTKFVDFNEQLYNVKNDPIRNEKQWKNFCKWDCKTYSYQYNIILSQYRTYSEEKVKRCGVFEEVSEELSVENYHLVQTEKIPKDIKDYEEFSNKFLDKYSQFFGIEKSEDPTFLRPRVPVVCSYRENIRNWIVNGRLTQKFYENDIIKKLYNNSIIRGGITFGDWIGSKNNETIKKFIMILQNSESEISFEQLDKLNRLQSITEECKLSPIMDKDGKFEDTIIKLTSNSCLCPETIAFMMKINDSKKFPWEFDEITQLAKTNYIDSSYSKKSIDDDHSKNARKSG